MALTAAQLGPADQIVATVRDPAKAAAFAARGVQVRAGDFGEPAAPSLGSPLTFSLA
jgi:uncharacterized protein YbjT (DUF2867 family)